MIHTNLGVIIEQRRRDRRPPYTDTDLAAAAGITRQAVYYIRTGKTTRYDARVLSGLCKALGVGVGDLLIYVPGDQR